ncbi:helix-turn-helix domain-containing protein [Streptomyces litchfieldiae]|uniref:Helix-turn-helix domain-containing protein n=1 Tax=Streptomyces litchfieldiae TaxID=3075543 RepID=A0ABU2N3C5_9ACTN|nr:helix-turn-helix domain-containing protein [Streptomyces sp. DSM 44938]MDT0347558.1 helix-turn-helix domain-containing protein [Streptomyces sp. DSM 44938]
MGVRGHRVEATVRASVAVVMNATGETLTGLGEVLGLSTALVGRRQRGVTPWTLAELGGLADHWGIPVDCLVAGPTETMAALPAERVAELRQAHGLPLTA